MCKPFLNSYNSLPVYCRRENNYYDNHGIHSICGQNVHFYSSLASNFSFFCSCSSFFSCFYSSFCSCSNYLISLVLLMTMKIIVMTTRKMRTHHLSLYLGNGSFERVFGCSVSWWMVILWHQVPGLVTSRFDVVPHFGSLNLGVLLAAMLLVVPLWWLSFLSCSCSLLFSLFLSSLLLF